MAITRISDLPARITAAKADWLVASHWIGFTPTSEAVEAASRCQATIAAQFADGYVIEYITRNFGTPNPGFEADPGYLAERASHAAVAGRLVAVHRLRPTARPLLEILGREDFDRTQDMWAEGGKRTRWSVAFPIVESYEITSKPLAREVFSAQAMQRLFAHPSATLRPLIDDERIAIAQLPIKYRVTTNAWIGIADEIVAAERSELDPKIVKSIEADLDASAMEGMSTEQRAKVRRRAAWLAQRFVNRRQREGTLRCDKCPFDPAALINGAPMRPRSLLDVHHLHPLEEGERVTTEADFCLLCPTCHRFEHALMRAARVKSPQFSA